LTQRKNGSNEKKPPKILKLKVTRKPLKLKAAIPSIKKGPKESEQIPTKIAIKENTLPPDSSQ